MQIPILVKPSPNGQGFIAHAGEPFAISAEGPSIHEALKKVEEAIREQIRAGALLFSFETNLTPAIVRASGIWPDDEITEAWLEGIAEYRKKCNEEPPLPWELIEEEGKEESPNGHIAAQDQATKQT